MFSLIISSLEIFNKNIKADQIIINDPMTTPNRPANNVFCSLDVYKSFYELLKYYFQFCDIVFHINYAADAALDMSTIKQDTPNANIKSP